METSEGGYSNNLMSKCGILIKLRILMNPNYGNDFSVHISQIVKKLKFIKKYENGGNRSLDPLIRSYSNQIK